MTKLTSFQADIRPLFTERDVNAMSKAFNLASYGDGQMDGRRVPTLGRKARTATRHRTHVER